MKNACLAKWCNMSKCAFPSQVFHQQTANCVQATHLLIWTRVTLVIKLLYFHLLSQQVSLFQKVWWSSQGLSRTKKRTAKRLISPKLRGSPELSSCFAHSFLEPSGTQKPLTARRFIVRKFCTSLVGGNSICWTTQKWKNCYCYASTIHLFRV